MDNEDGNTHAMGSSMPGPKVVIVNLPEGDYKVTNKQSGASFIFKVEAGGILTSDQVNGSL